MVSLTEEDLVVLRELAHEIRFERRQVAQATDAVRYVMRDKPPTDAGAAMKVQVGPNPDVMPKPGLGSVVVYRARTRGYELPAIVTANVETLDRRGVIRGHVPDITGEDHVHLNVQTCGEQLAYQEHDVPFSRDPIPGTWGWR